MPFFDRPVEKPEELFDREKEFESLKKAVDRYAMTIVVGFRRVGKTSLIKAATIDMPRIYVDVRKFEVLQYITYDMFLDELRKSLSNFLSFDKRVAEYLNVVKGLKVFGIEVELSQRRSRPLFTSILESLDRWARDRGVKLVFIIDEAQELIKLKGYSIIQAIAYAYDNLRNITFLFAGSKIGLLYRFLKIHDPSSPLYGRYIERIELKPLTREKAIEFLRKGFEEHRIKVDEVFLETAVQKLGGIIGWLSYLGLKTLNRGETNLRIIDEVVEEASKIVINEFCNFINAMGSKRYIEMVRAVSSEGATWSQIKRYLELRLGVKIYDSELSRLLKNLIDNGYIEKTDELYTIPDPILKYSSKSIKC